MKKEQYQEVLKLYEDLPGLDNPRKRMNEEFKKMDDEISRRGIWGSWDLNRAVEDGISYVFKKLKPYIKDFPDFKRVCKAMPSMAGWLSFDSETDMLGHTFWPVLDPVDKRISKTKTLDDFIAPFEREGAPAVCSDCGGDMSESKSGNTRILKCKCGTMKHC